MLSRFANFLKGNPMQVVQSTPLPVVEENKVPNKPVYFDISKDISEDITNTVKSLTNFNQGNKPNIFKNILSDIDTFIIDEEGSIKPIGKFKEFNTEEGELFGNGTVPYTNYYVIFSRNEETKGNEETDGDKKTKGNEETKITIYTNTDLFKVVLPKFYISFSHLERYNELKSKLATENTSGGKPKTRRNIRKRQKKYSRKNRIKSRRNRLMK